jgi:peptide/nickel transport system substrate-binding protein
MRSTSRALSVAVAAGLTVLMTACGGGGGGGTEPSGDPGAEFNAGSNEVVNPSDAKGGTLRIVSADDWDSVDPGNTYYAYSWDFARLYGRALMMFKSAPGKDGLTVVPDLAAGPGQVSDDGRTWTYKLRPNLKYDDGSPVSSKDVKYAVERSNYAPDVLSNGPTYFKALLGTDYAGPYKDTAADKLGLTAIETPDDTTIIFRLQQPFAEFDFLATNVQTIPVPAAKDDGAKYAQHVLSTGPYKIDSYEIGKSLKLSRNPNWNAADDPNRRQLVDRIEVTLKVDAQDVDNRLTAGDADLDLQGTGVQAATQAKILTNPNVKKNADNPFTGFHRYVAISTTIKPLDNIHCRNAVIYAADHVALQTAYGGPSTGDIATTLMPPNVVGYEKADHFEILKSPNGNVEKAKAELKECGRPDGFSTVISARSDRPKEVNGAQALQQALAKVGIRTDIQQYPSGQYFANYAGSTNFIKQHNIGLMFMGWAADWPAGYGFLQQITDGRAIKASGNSNLSELNDPGINALIDQLATSPDVGKRTELATQIDAKAIASAAFLPVIYEKALVYRNPEVTNAYIQPAYGIYDFVAMGVKPQ